MALMHRFSGSQELAIQVAEAIAELIRHDIAQRGIFRIALSGGSTPRVVYSRLARDRGIAWDRVLLCWGDERNVLPEDSQSNFRMVKESLLDPAQVPATSYLPVPIHIEKPQQAALEYENSLRERFQGADEGGWPRWDLVLLGLGDDCHCASLFPNSAALHVKDRWFIDNWVPQLNDHRLTLTFPAINSAREVWFIVSGQGKQRALETVWSGPRDIHRYPAQGIQPTHGRLQWWLG
jgi:6-phosphogluconolactonase